MLCSEEYALHIDRLHPIPFGLGDFMGGLVGAGDAGVVHDDIDLTEHRGDLGHDLLDLALGGHVASPVRRALIAARQFPGERGALVIQDVEQRDLRAFLGHSSADRLSDP